MYTSSFTIKIKTYFRNLNFYSIPLSILFIVRKRLNLVFFITILIIFVIYSLI